MSEFARLLRYAIPGGVFELLLAVGLLIAHPDCAMLVKNTGLSGQALVTLMVAAAFPLGFLISVIANEIAWLWHKICPQRRLWGRISTTCILGIVQNESPYHHLLQKVVRNEDKQSLVEIILRSYNKGEAYQVAGDRLRSMADLLNGLINAFIAILLALLVCAVTCLPKVERDSDSTFFFVISIVLLGCLWMAEQRLARIAEAFAIGMIRARWR